MDRASSLIEFFKTLTKNIFECAHKYGHPNIIKIKHRIILLSLPLDFMLNISRKVIGVIDVIDWSHRCD